MLIVDVSFAHDAVTGQLLVDHGIDGVIGYASRDPRKNMTAANLTDWLSHGLLVGLVYEDTELDMTGGRLPGVANAENALNWGRTIGYDVANCVIFAANDRNTENTDRLAYRAYMQGFSSRIKHSGYYGDQDSIDFLWSMGGEYWNWQSESQAFGHGVSEHAHLVQRFNDQRVAGLPMDANDVLIPGIPWMGEDMFTDADRVLLQQAAGRAQHADYTAGLELPAISEMRGNVQNIARAVTGLHTAPDPAALATALAPLIHSVDPVELQTAIQQALNSLTLTVTSTQG